MTVAETIKSTVGLTDNTGMGFNLCQWSRVLNGNIVIRGGSLTRSCYIQLPHDKRCPMLVSLYNTAIRVPTS